MTKRIGVSLTALATIEMNEEDVRLELEIYDNNYIPTAKDWDRAIDKRINFYLRENYFLKEEEAEINDVEFDVLEVYND